MSSIIRVFVYGTLKNGQPNHYLMTNIQNGLAKFIGKAKTTEKFPLVISTRYNIPFLLHKPGIGNLIEGEIYEVDENMFKILDKLEDYPNWYDRVIHECQLIDQDSLLPCWIYVLKNYPENLLSLNFLSSYEDKPDRAYIESDENFIPWEK